MTGRPFEKASAGPAGETERSLREKALAAKEKAKRAANQDKSGSVENSGKHTLEKDEASRRK